MHAGTILSCMQWRSCAHRWSVSRAPRMACRWRASCGCAVGAAAAARSVPPQHRVATAATSCKIAVCAVGPSGTIAPSVAAGVVLRRDRLLATGAVIAPRSTLGSTKSMSGMS